MALIKSAFIRDVKVSEKTTWRHLVIETGDAAGYGEFTLDAASPEFTAEAHRAATSLTGLDTTEDIGRAFSELRKRDLQGAAIVSAIDQAVHDIRARATGQPLTSYLGGANADRSIALYANVNRRTTDRSPEGFQASALDAAAKGFTAIKIAPFDGLTPSLCGSKEAEVPLQNALDRISAVRGALGPDAELLVDCHWRLNRSTARELIPHLSRLGVSWFECPLPEVASNLDDLAALRSKANDHGIRLAGCETMTLWEGFRQFVERGAYDVIMPDVKYVGGFAALRETAETARRYGVAISLHNPTGPICHLHSLHAASALDLSERLELQFEESPMFESIIDPPPPSRIGGTSKLPLGPGIGAALAHRAEKWTRFSAPDDALTQG